MKTLAGEVAIEERSFQKNSLWQMMDGWMDGVGR